MANTFDEFLDDELISVPQDEAEKKDESKDVNTVVIKNKNKETQEEPKPEKDFGDSKLYVIRTTANREDQVFDFLESNIKKKKINAYSILKSHGMRSYIFIETTDIQEAQRSIYGIPYARGILPRPVDFSEVESMLDTGKKEVNIKKNDVVEIISGPFKREKAKITRVDRQKGEVIVELLEAAVSIPITLKFDAVKVIRRDEEDQ
ncbi:MAG: transcription elongation factor Spt5 [Nanobdellota archaeon]